MAPRVSAAPAPVADGLSRTAERVLRWIGDARMGLTLLLVTALANGVAALLPDGPRLLDAWPYAILLGLVALSGVAAVATRAPAAWREWRRPGPVRPGRGALLHALALRTAAEVAADLGAAGYRIRLDETRGRWAVHGVRRGWSRFGGQASHLALVVIVVGVAVGSAFGTETTFSLFPGDQALLDAPRPGFSAAVRLESFDAEFGPDRRPRRLDTTVTFLRDGSPVSAAVLRVNEPGSFDGYLVHPWTYGPAARLRVTTLGGGALLDAAVPLDGVRDGVPVGSAELPTAGVTLGLALANASTNELGVSVVDTNGLVDTVRLRPGDSERVGDLMVGLDRFDAWVTLLSRRDPGLPILFTGAGLLSGGLAIAFWLPRRRVSVRAAGGGMTLTLRGERYDDPSDELDRLARRLGASA
jgi:cytochrome c biogenesis protein ResB